MSYGPPIEIHGPVRIIHLEDNPMDRDLVAALLKSNGIECEIIYAENRDSFRAALEQVDADLIISDFSLPGYDGGLALKVAREIRSDVPFIFFSGTIGEEAAVESLKQGATDYVLKQRPGRLMVAVRRALEETAAKLARERMGEVLRQRDSLLRNIMENVEDLIAVLDLEGRVVLTSPSHRKLFGANAPVVGSDFFSFVHPGDLEQTKQAFRRAITDRICRNVEYRLLPPVGSVRFLEAQGNLMSNENGRDQCVLWLARDITERRIAEQQILEQAALLDEARDAICVTDLDQRIHFWNKSAERLYGWTANEATGRNANILLCQDEVALTALKTLIQRGEWNGELHQTTRDGTHLVVASRWTLIRDENNAPKTILVINTDITVAKKAEQKILEQAALLDKARDAILVCDLEQSIVYWNEGASRLYGSTPAEAIGHRLEDYLSALDPAEEASIRNTVLEKGEWIGELRQKSREGKELVVQSRQTLVRDSSGRPTSVLYINSDITEQKKIETQFLRTQRMESIGALAGGIAHDLNNVLGPIMMAVEVIQNDPGNKANLGLLDLVGSSAKRGSELVKQILSFARGIGNPKALLRLSPLVAEVVKLASDTFPRSILVRSRIPDNLPNIHGDATQVHQILLNLFVNARDAMPGGGSIQVEAAAVNLNQRRTRFHPDPLSGGFVEIKVSDTGTGIPPEALPKIFEPFFTTKEPGKGTGLGLSTVIGIVKAHGGILDVESEVGRGTTFSIYLPLAEAQPVPAPATGGGDPNQGRGEGILIVDDEEAILEITRATLSAFNYRAYAAHSGEDAMAIVSGHPGEIDLVITDMAMPEMDGPALIEALRKVRKDMPVIVVSGLPLGKNEPIGIKGFLRKPYTTTSLLKSIRSALGTS